MNLTVRDGKFDLAILAGPRVEHWPSVGVRKISTLCAETGLTVGQFGGEFLTVRGVIPLPGTGGIIFIEDVQRRIHRIHARAIVRMSPDFPFPAPFPGWHSPGLIPLATAERLMVERQVQWDPCTAILGTGNRALKFATRLLQAERTEVFCIETYAQWGAKRFAGWEVERRQFEMLGGRLIEAKPLQLAAKGPLQWQLRVQDTQGVRVLEVARVVAAGPFRDLPGIQEYPPGSFLFELSQTAEPTYVEDAEGWSLEEERANGLAIKIIKALITELGPSRKENLERTLRNSRRRLKRVVRHREAPFLPAYQGKWIEVSDAKKIRNAEGVPKFAHTHRPVASLECFEEIPCTICQDICPTDAIQTRRTERSQTLILKEADCTACGLCIRSCPSSSIPMIQENQNRPTSILTLPWHGTKLWLAHEFATLVNRRGENLGSARILEVKESNPQLVLIEVPHHLLWEARGIKRARPPASEDEVYLAAVDRSSKAEKKIEITLNGDKRVVRDQIPISLALFEMGQSRSTDVLFCRDGSCGRCQITVDGISKLACQTQLHRGMAIRSIPPGASESSDETLCPCLGISSAEVVERIQKGGLRSPEAVLAVTHVGEGKCHGQLCMENFKRLLSDQELPVAQWIDWRFPWSDWDLEISRS